MKPDPRAVESALAEIERQSLKRLRRTIDGAGPGGAEVVVDGRRLVNFCGNDYLGLAQHPLVIAALREAAASCGVGSGASHLVTGHGREHERLEEELARFVGRERALLLSTGYMANLAVVTALVGRGDLLLLDRLSHASLIDAALLSRARLRRYPHADAGAVRHVLALESSRDPASERVTLVATDGVFSMDGDIAPLGELAAAAAQHHAWLLVDDAHGLGVLGATGRGTLEHLGLGPTAVPLLMATLGKALGTFGAFIAGARDVIELVMQRARSYIYTTAAPQAVAAATRAALSVVEREPWRRDRVLALTERFRRAARERSLPLGPSPTPIQPILLGAADTALTASRRLLDSGFWVAAIRPPTVPRNTARLRVTLSAAHSESQVDALVEALSHSLPRHGSA